MKFDKAIAWRAVCAIASATLLASAFLSRGESRNVFFALVPMLIVARSCAPKTAAKWWAVFGFGFWFAMLSWMPAIIKNNGPWPLVVLGWGALAAYCALYMVAFGVIDSIVWRILSQSPFPDPRSPIPVPRSLMTLLVLTVVEPVVWCELECLRANLFGGFAWGFLGVPASTFKLCIGCASVGGVYAVSAIAFLSNSIATTVLMRALGPMMGRPRDPKSLPLRIVRFLETALPLGIVLALISVPRPVILQDEAVPVRVALVQRNFPCIFAKGDQAESPYDAYAGLMAQASLIRPDLVVFSESAMSEFPGRGNVINKDVREAAGILLGRAGITGSLLAGGDYVEHQSDGGYRVYNAAALYDARAANDLPQVYCKQHLVPFGEYIPMDKWIPALQRLSPIGVSLYPGEPKLLVLPVVRGAVTNKVEVAPLICFEDLDASLTRKAAKLGAQLIAVLTNDSWFSNSIEAEQHFNNARIRATETGIPMVRTGNSGVTAVVFPGGGTRVLDTGDGKPLVDAKGFVAETVHVSSSPRRTWYTRLGDGPLEMMFLASILLIFALAYRRRIR